MVFINKIAKEIGFDSQVNRINTTYKTYPNEVT